MSVDGLSKLSFRDSGNSDFIKFKADEAVKLKVFSTDPIVSKNEFKNAQTGEVSVGEKFGFAVWNYNESRPMILNASPSVARGIHELHTDPDFGEDITKLDIKILPTGEMLERRYTINVLPKAQTLNPDDWAKVEELDKKLDSILKNGSRASLYNERGHKEVDEVAEVTEEDLDREILDTIPF